EWFWPLRIAASVALLTVIYISFNSIFDSVEPGREIISLQSTEPPSEEKTSKNNIETVPTEPAIKPEMSEEINQSPKSSSKNTADETSTLATAPIQKQEDEKSESEIEVSDQIIDKQVAATFEKEKSVALAQEEARISHDLSTKKESAGRAYAIKPSTDISGKVIRGKVVYAEDGKPLPGTNVLVKGTTQGTVTNMNGEYTLTTTVKDPVLLFSFVGFQSAEVNANDQDEVNISLKSDIAQLSEVVVTGYSAQPGDAIDPVIKLAEPVGGRKAYDKYLQNSLIYPAQALENKVKGRVTVQFTVRTDGGVDEFNIIKGLGYGCDEEVIRLVKEGPKWKPTTENDVPVESEVLVRVKFALPN
ncbi:MAG: TonB family protein, partial [Cyclobacteriaceae bacterium]|nr:TonB family protein [Cyclobacteriaceae bacterium]